MKKILPFAALLLAAVSSWAFYPKTTEPTGYMMVIGSATFAAYVSRAEVTLVDAAGQTTVEEIDVRGGAAKQVTASLNKLHIAELRKINEYKQQGWVVTQTLTQSVAGVLNTTYLLEKR